jgi:predicted P-loop ATPase
MTTTATAVYTTNSKVPPVGRRLTQSHEQMLIRDSGIDPKVVTERDAWTAINVKELSALGFAGHQQLVPALVLPVWSVNGQAVTYQIRPNTPRTKDGKTIKYETPAGPRVVLDVHPRIRGLLNNPQNPLYITEGIRKADAAVSMGLCCVALLGVTNWRGTNANGGKTPLICWQSIALNGRTVYITFDSDSASNPMVLRQAVALGEYLESKDAQVQVITLPAGTNGAKVGLDDYFVAGGTPGGLLAYAEPLKKAAKRLRQATRDATSSDYVDALKHFGYTFRLNDCSDTVEVNGTPLADALQAKMRAQMRDSGFTQPSKHIEDAYIAEAYDQRYHPIKDYLTNLKWDGDPHIEDLAAFFTDAHPPTQDQDGEQCSVFALWLRRWLIGAVAKVLNAEQNVILVLDGPQGTGKSEFVRWLASGIGTKYFIERSINSEDKDTLMNLLNYFVWEVSELGATTRRADVEALKAIITMREVRVRPAYGHHDVIKPAMASMIGTINNDAGFLNDPTGSRRYAVVTLTGINWEYTSIDVNQVWAEAVARYQMGEAWRLGAAEQTTQRELNQEYELADPIEGMLQKHFYIDADSTDWMSAADILEVLAERGLRGNPRANQMMVASALRRLGIRKGRTLVDGQRQYGYWGLMRKYTAAEENLPL